jgi:hypothetical protein
MSNNKKESKKNINWKIVGGIAVTLAAAGVATYVITQKRKKNERKTTEKEENKEKQ